MKHKVSDATIVVVCTGRKHFGQIEAVDLWRLKALEQENAQLKG
jgi:hypothetical protein